MRLTNQLKIKWVWKDKEKVLYSFLAYRWSASKGNKYVCCSQLSLLMLFQIVKMAIFLIFPTDGSTYAEGIVVVYSNFKPQNY